MSQGFLKFLMACVTKLNTILDLVMFLFHLAKKKQK